MKLLFIVLAGIVGILIGHCMMAFYWLSFDPSTWTAEARYLALNLYLIGGVLSAFGVECSIK